MLKLSVMKSRYCNVLSAQIEPMNGLDFSAIL